VTTVDARLEDIALQHGIELILLFGSSVSGPVHPRSDVDLAVLLGRPTLPLREHAELAGELQRLFPDREVDVVLINRADPLFLKKITERCGLLYGSPRRLAELKLYAFRRYQDHRKYLMLEREYVTRALGGGRRP
jgi:predicted nucleotidyltransferase